MPRPPSKPLKSPVTFGLNLRPNVTSQGGRVADINYTTLFNGAFYNDGVSKPGINGSANNSANLYFDASLSNSIYTDNGRVKPLSLVLNYTIKL